MRKSVWELLKEKKVDENDIYSLIKDIDYHTSDSYYERYYNKFSSKYGSAKYENLIFEITENTKNRSITNGWGVVLNRY